jgi:hypothetical protein
MFFWQASQEVISFKVYSFGFFYKDFLHILNWAPGY